MNNRVSEREPNLGADIDPEKTRHLQTLVVQLSVIHDERFGEETPMPDEVAIERHGNLESDDISEKEDKIAQRTFGMVGRTDGATTNILVRESADVSPDFRAVEGKTVGRESTIKSGCSSKSSIGKKVHMGHGVRIEDNCTIGAINLKRWRRSESYTVDGKEEKRFIEYETYIGDRVSIGFGATVRPYSTIGSDVQVGAKAEIGKSVSLKKVDGHNRENQTIPAKPTFVGDYCHIGDGAVLEAGCRIGKGYEIEPGLVVPKTVDLPDNPHLSDGRILIDTNWVNRYKERQRKLLAVAKTHRAEAREGQESAS